MPGATPPHESTRQSGYNGNDTTTAEAGQQEGGKTMDAEKLIRTAAKGNNIVARDIVEAGKL